MQQRELKVTQAKIILGDKHTWSGEQPGILFAEGAVWEKLGRSWGKASVWAFPCHPAKPSHKQIFVQNTRHNHHRHLGGT